MVRKLFHIDLPETGNTNDRILSLEVGEKHAGFAITSKQDNHLIELAYYATDQSNGNPLPDIFNQHVRTANTFDQVQIVYNFPQSTLVPLSHYKEEDKSLLLNTLYGVNASSTVLSESVNQWQLYNVYAVPQEVQSWINGKFHGTDTHHHYSIGLQNLEAADASGHIMTDFRADDFTLIAGAAGKLLLAQTFAYNTPEDVLYYLLKVCQEFDLSQKEVRLSLSGLVDKQSVLYKELYQYFINLDFREAGWTITDKEYPAHFFTSLNDLARCAS